jgi:hypothetical protein
MFTGQSPNFSGHNTILPLPGGRALLIYTNNQRRTETKADGEELVQYSAELIGTFVKFERAASPPPKVPSRSFRQNRRTQRTSVCSIRA